MTKEQAKAILENMHYELSNQTASDYCKKKYEAISMAIKALEQPTCDDCVSRQAVLNTLFYKSDNNCEVVLNKELQDRIKALPPLTPTRNKPKEDITEDEVIINMLELALNQVREQAENIIVLTDNIKLTFKAEKRGSENE